MTLAGALLELSDKFYRVHTQLVEDAIYTLAEHGHRVTEMRHHQGDGWAPYRKTELICGDLEMATIPGIRVHVGETYP